jgi:hypothetical protein
MTTSKEGLVCSAYLKTNLRELNDKAPAQFANDFILNYSDYLKSKEIVPFSNYKKKIEDTGSFNP